MVHPSPKLRWLDLSDLLPACPGPAGFTVSELAEICGVIRFLGGKLAHKVFMCIAATSLSSHPAAYSQPFPLSAAGPVLQGVHGSSKSLALEQNIGQD